MSGMCQRLWHRLEIDVWNVLEVVVTTECIRVPDGEARIVNR